MESFSIDTVLSISSSHELPGDQLLEEISRVLKPGGTILIYKKLTSDKGDADKVNLFLFVISFECASGKMSHICFP